jgi:homoserine O-acetyltransferase
MSRTKTQFCRIATPDHPFRFATGEVFDDLQLAYSTHGTLNANKDNAILVFHALSGSHHIAGEDTVGPGSPLWTKENHRGWWDGFVGPRRPIDTREYFVICANYLGGCYGSTGPSSINPATGKPYGSAFPWMTIGDIVDSNIRLLEHLGIKRLLAVIGGSMGGFCVLNLAARFPERVACVIPIATGARATVLARAMNFEQIYAIEEDRHFNKGNYYDGPAPVSGLKLARMISHKTFVSLSVLEQRARKEIIQPQDALSGYRLEHQVESYLLHQGRKFAERFDANSHLRILNAWQDFDLVKDLGRDDLSKTLHPCRHQRWLLFSISSDACFYPEEQLELANALRSAGVDYQHITVNSDKGHDSFLLEPDLFGPHIAYKLANTRRLLKDAESEKRRRPGRRGARGE